ncbi:hypothetical protein PN613_15455 [Parabacteroides distasonis]|nr:hypothetical protein [Parabacteroides distasonis]MDB8997929.1 hypothetical protein [Parabacteroides distasonis]MDB9072628.1 hypothetical protein [Parabacteroides distasonis]
MIDFHEAFMQIPTAFYKSLSGRASLHFVEIDLPGGMSDLYGVMKLILYL